MKGACLELGRRRRPSNARHVWPIHSRSTSSRRRGRGVEAIFTASQAATKHHEDAEAKLAPALEKITVAVTEHWSTGSGRCLRQIVWSIYNGRALVNLGDVLTNFDGELCEAVATLNHAKLCSVDMDDLLREVLKRSGEFFRYEEAERKTPEDEEVLYPPIQVSAERLRRLADSAARLKTALKRGVRRKWPLTPRKTINDGRYPSSRYEDIQLLRWPL